MSIVNTINRLRRTIGLKDFTPTYSDTEPKTQTTINDQITDSVTTEMPEIDIPGGDEVDIMQEFEPLDAEVLEFRIHENSEIAFKKVSDFPFKEGAIIAGIVRRNDGFIPTKDFIIEPKDHVVVFSQANLIPKVTKYFK